MTKVFDVMTLKAMQCEPCRNDAKPATEAEIKRYLEQLPQWQCANDDGVPTLRRQFEFNSYTSCLQFAHQVGMAAEAVDHHPVMEITWGKVTVTWWTHTINGLHLNDFIMADRCNDIYAGFNT